MKQLTALLFGLALLLPACGEEKEQEPAAEEERTYTLMVDAAREDGAIEVSGETNLPDGGVIQVSASRAQRHADEDDVRAISAGRATATIEDAAYSTTIEEIDESDLTIGIDPSVFGPLEAIDSHLTVCAEFQTGEDLDDEPRQPDADVRDEVGDFGEQLEGSPEAAEFGAATNTPSWWLKADTRLEYPVTVLDELRGAGEDPAIRPLRGFCL